MNIKRKSAKDRPPTRGEEEEDHHVRALQNEIRVDGLPENLFAKADRQSSFIKLKALIERVVTELVTDVMRQADVSNVSAKTGSRQKPSEEPLLRLRDVAKRLQVSEKLVRRLTIKKGLRFVKIGRELRFKREWVDEFVDRVQR
jgi:excisionase family DNA binding protein